MGALGRALRASLEPKDGAFANAHPAGARALQSLAGGHGHERAFALGRPQSGQRGSLYGEDGRKKGGAVLELRGSEGLRALMGLCRLGQTFPL